MESKRITWYLSTINNKTIKRVNRKAELTHFINGIPVGDVRL